MNALRLAVATGAGISAESGVPTFRDADGLWHGRRPEEVATPEAFRRDPEDVWNFYLARRRNLLAVRPNAGHEAVAAWQERFGGAPVITQNVDGLHQCAGSREVIELHGSIWRRHCQDCGSARPDEAVELNGKLPRCSCGGLMRPSIVWFGENLPDKAFERARLLARAVRVLVVVGTSNLVYPAASIPLAALAAGVTVIEVNPEPTPLTAQGVLFRQGTAGAILPTLDGELEGLLGAPGR